MEPFTEERPWGSFRQFTHQEPTTVKLLTIKAREAFSLQLHKKRSEFWRVISGNPIVTLDEKEIEAKPGDEFFVEVGMKHRINGGKDGAVILEVGYGEFEENDIVRFNDKYGRP